MDEKKELTRGEQLRRALTYQKKNGYDRLQPGELEAIEAYCSGYKQFLDGGKTERECVDRTIAPMLTPWSRPFRPITASITALPRLDRYTLSPGLSSMPRT